MRIILALIKKEFLQIFRNKIMIRIIFGVPILQLILMVYAANFEMKNLTLGIVDRDRSEISRKITAKMQASGYFRLADFTTCPAEAMEKLEKGVTDMVIEIPAGFERDLYKGESPRLAVTANAINSMRAGLAVSYMGNILGAFGQELRQDLPGANVGSSPVFDITYSNWFNPRLDYKTLMLPGMLAILITLIGVLISSLNIVREKEAGTIEQLNVTPINKFQFIIGKLFPFGVIGMIQLTMGLLLAVFLFGLKIEGSLLLIYGVVALYLTAILGLGFLISTISETQIQAMFITMFFLFIFILLSGLFTPIQSMPLWAQRLDLINPTAYLVEIIRLVVLKGSTFADIRSQVAVIGIFAVCINSLVVWRYRKIS